jgi:hypothetical protein
MAEAVHEIAHEATHSAAHGQGGRSKLIGLLISVLALFLAVSELLGNSSQTAGLAMNIEASNTWNFFQAKTVRQTAVRTAIENAKMSDAPSSPERDKQLAAWQANVDRWESEPSTNEGRKELMARAKKLEAERDAKLAQYHAYEVISLIFQLGIVLASVSLLSTIMGFALVSMALGLFGLITLAGTYLNWQIVTAILH